MVSVSPVVAGMLVLAVVSGVVPPVGSVPSHLSPGIMHIKYHTMILYILHVHVAGKFRLEHFFFTFLPPALIYKRNLYPINFCPKLMIT